MDASPSCISAYCCVDEKRRQTLRNVTKLVKYVLAAVAVGGLYYLVTTAAKTVTDWASKITLHIVQFGKPSISSGTLRVPLLVRINNPSPLYAPIDSVSVKLFFLRNGMYVPFGSAPGTAPFELKPNGDTDITLNPAIDLKALNPFTGGLNVSNLLTQAQNLLTSSNPLIDIKAEVTITVKGYELVQEANSKIYLNQLLNAA